MIEETSIKVVPFIPRFDDALVAEFIHDEALTLEGHMKVFAGLQMGYDRRGTLQLGFGSDVFLPRKRALISLFYMFHHARGDLLFLKDVGNLTEWAEDRAMPFYAPQTTRQAMDNM